MRNGSTCGCILFVYHVPSDPAQKTGKVIVKFSFYDAMLVGICQMHDRFPQAVISMRRLVYECKTAQDDIGTETQQKIRA